MQKNNRIVLLIVGATTEVATLKQALSKAEKRAATERTEREKHEMQVGEVRQELQALMKKHESLELESMTQASELAAALESTKHAKAEAQKALQEVEAMRKIAAGKEFCMQSRHIKVNYLLLTRIRSSPGAFHRSSPQRIRCRRILPSRGRQLDEEGVLVSVCSGRTPRALEQPAEATGRAPQGG